MTAERYRREMDGVRMSDSFREELILTMTNTEMEEKPVKKRVFRTVMVAAALCAALTVAALAAFPSLRESLAEALGSFQPYSQEVEGVSATDQGIQIKLVSLLADETDGTAYVEVTDLTGDRLGMDMELREGRRRLHPTAYDAETKTALFAVPLRPAINEIHSGRAEELELSFTGLYPGRVELPCEEVTTKLPDGKEYGWWKGTDFPKELYATETLSTRALTEEEQAYNYANYADLPVLVSGQTPADLDSPYFSLSSAGFDGDGYYHVQFAMAEGVYLYEPADLDMDICPGMLLEDVGLDGMSYRRVLLEGGKYVDITFLELTPEILGRLPDGTITGQVSTAPAIQGQWSLSHPFEPLEETVLALNQPFCYPSIGLLDARLTAMSFQLTYTYTDNIYLGGQPVHLFCKDGGVLKLKFQDQALIYQNADGETAPYLSLTGEQRESGDWKEYAQRDSWSYPRAVAPQDVVGFSFGQWYVPLDGSGTGRWLAQLPQATE